MRYLAAVGMLAIVLVPAAYGQVHRRDPLTNAESDELRESSMEPEKKLPTYVKFARARLATIEQLRSDARFAQGRGPKIYDLLEDFRVIMDEMDRNLDSFANQKLDFRKALKEIIQADSEFQLKLRALKETSRDSAFAGEMKDYEFALLDATDTVDGDLDNARELLQEQEKAAAEAKAAKKAKGKK